jgi:hypothetical protein
MRNQPAPARRQSATGAPARPASGIVARSASALWTTLLVMVGVLGATTSTGVAAEDGLSSRGADWLWPQLQARITLQTASLTPVSLARGAELGNTPARGQILGAAMLGDYVFARPSIGQFRTTSGVMLGSTAGAPLLSTQAAARLDVQVRDVGSQWSHTGGEILAAMPYVGLGYSSPRLWGHLSVSADFGLAAARPAGMAGVGRALFGAQALDAALRDMRWAPLMQLGVRYSY